MTISARPGGVDVWIPRAAAWFFVIAFSWPALTDSLFAMFWFVAVASALLIEASVTRHVVGLDGRNLMVRTLWRNRNIPLDEVIAAAALPGGATRGFQLILEGQRTPITLGRRFGLRRGNAQQILDALPPAQVAPAANGDISRAATWQDWFLPILAALALGFGGFMAADASPWVQVTIVVLVGFGMLEFLRQWRGQRSLRTILVDSTTISALNGKAKPVRVPFSGLLSVTPQGLPLSPARLVLEHEAGEFTIPVEGHASQDVLALESRLRLELRRRTGEPEGST